MLRAFRKLACGGRSVLGKCESFTTMNNQSRDVRTIQANKFYHEYNKWGVVQRTPNEPNYADPAYLESLENVDLDEITFVTFNVWFASTHFDERAEALFRIVEQLHPHFICLQEVTPRFVMLIREQAWVKKEYYCSDTSGNTVHPYGVLMLTRLSTPAFHSYSLPTNMGRKLLVTDTRINNQLFRVSTVHLESLQNPNYRKAQLDLIFPILERHCSHSAIMGDFNFCSESSENANILPEYMDSWPFIMGNSAEAIENGKTRKNQRLDRVLIRSSMFKPHSIHKLGTEPISEALPDVFPSDHNGLYVCLRKVE